MSWLKVLVHVLFHDLPQLQPAISLQHIYKWMQTDIQTGIRTAQSSPITTSHLYITGYGNFLYSLVPIITYACIWYMPMIDDLCYSC